LPDLKEGFQLSFWFVDHKHKQSSLAMESPCEFGGILSIYVLQKQFHRSLNP
jgi:hypothetical protein